MDTALIGNYISELRKSRDWTQRQLAKQLNVTHQAVSKWEKGVALPDVETLMAIAKLFGITVDMLLNARAHDESVDKVDEKTELDVEDSKADNIKPKFKYVVNKEEDEDANVHIHIDGDLSGEKNDSIKKIASLAPFVSKEILDKKFLELINDEESIESGVIIMLAPFLSEHVLKTAIGKIADGEVDPKLIHHVAPFVKKQDLADLVIKMQDNEWILEHLVELAPFLPKDFVDEIFQSEI